MDLLGDSSSLLILFDKHINDIFDFGSRRRRVLRLDRWLGNHDLPLQSEQEDNKGWGTLGFLAVQILPLPQNGEAVRFATDP